MAGADWAAFATAFFNDTAKYINERKDKASEYEDKLREEAEKSKGIVEGRIQLANTAKSIASKLKSKGATEEMIRAAAASGPNGLVDLDRAFSAAETKYGADIVRQNPEIIAATSLTAEQARMTGEGAIGLDAFIEQSYGVSAPTTGSVDAGEVSIWDKMLGRNAKERVRAKLDAEMASMGYSIYDINEAAKSAEYKSLVPGAYVEYKTPKIFTQEGAADEITTLNNLVRYNEVYKAAEEAYKTALENYSESAKMASTQGTPELAALEAKLDAARQKLRDAATNILEPYVKGQAGFYGMESYQKTMAPMIDNIVGIDGFTDSLFTKAKPEDAAAPADQTTEAIPTGDEQSTTAAPEKTTIPTDTKTYKPTGKVVKSNRFGEVEVAEAEDGSKTFVTTKPMQAANGTIVPAGTPIPSNVTQAELDAMERAGMLSEKTPEEVKQQLEETGRAPITKEEASQLSRKEREAMGLPETPLGAFFRDPAFTAPTATESKYTRDTAKPDEYYAVKIPGIPGWKRVKGADLALISDADLEKQQGTIEIRPLEEGEKLSSLGSSRMRKLFGGKAAPKATTKPKGLGAKPEPEEDMTFINP